MTRVLLPLNQPIARLPFPVPAFLTTTAAGDMKNDHLRVSVLRQMGYASDRTLMLRQEHTRDVLTMEEARSSTAALSSMDRIAGDGLLARGDGVALAVGVGDCVPILLFDPASGAFGVLHSGWKGTGILSIAIKRMSAVYGTVPANLIVLLGPGISADSYEVDEERAREYQRWGNGSVVYREHRAYLHLHAANQMIARESGVPEIYACDHCTMKDPRLGSFRRQGSGYTGMMVVVGRRADEEREEQNESGNCGCGRSSL